MTPDPRAQPLVPRILVVDDDAGLADVVRRVLERNGHEVRVAATGLEGARQYREQAADLAIVDIHNSPVGSSSGPPGACITPSNVRNVLIASFLIVAASHMARSMAVEDGAHFV